MNDIQDINTMLQLLRIPAIRQNVFFKINELAIFFQEDVEHLLGTIEHFKKIIYPSIDISNDPQPECKNRDKAYFFELTKEEKEPWHISLEPLPPSGYDIRDILPEGIILHMESYPVAPRKDINIEGFELSAIKGTVFDLTFIRYSPFYILGVVTPRNNSYQEKREAIFQYDPALQCDEFTFTELEYYMKNYPAVKAYFASELHMKIKPWITANQSEFTSYSPQ